MSVQVDLHGVLFLFTYATVVFSYRQVGFERTGNAGANPRLPLIPLARAGLDGRIDRHARGGGDLPMGQRRRRQCDGPGYPAGDGAALVFSPISTNRWSRRNRTLGLGTGAGASWEQTRPTVWRFHLRPNVKWQDGSPFTADDVVFTPEAYPGEEFLDAGANVAGEGSPQDRRPDGGVRNHVPDPIFLQEQTNLLIMSKAWCEAHNATEPVIIGKDDNYALHNAMGTGPFKLVSREPDRKTVVEKNPLLVGQARTQPGPGGVRRDRLRANAGGGTAVGRNGHDLQRAAAGHGADQADPGLKLCRRQSCERSTWASTRAGRIAQFRRQGQEPVQGRAGARRPSRWRSMNRPSPAASCSAWGIPRLEMWGPGVNGYDAALDVRPKPDPAKAKHC